MTDSNEQNAALARAVIENNPAAIRASVAAGAEVNERDEEGNTVLMNAVSFGCLADTIITLIACGADIGATNNAGETAVIAGARSDLGGNFAILVARGADIHARDAAGATALMGAWHSNIGVLIDAGADVNACDCEGNTPLMYACRYGYAHAVIELLDHGADPNVSNHTKKTAMWLAQNTGLCFLKELHTKNPEYIIEKICRLLRQVGAQE